MSLQLASMIPNKDITLISKMRLFSNNMTKLKTESTSIQISVSDIETRNNRIKREMIEVGGAANTQKERIVTLVKEWAYNLELLVDNKLVQWGKDVIYSTILANLHKDGMSDVGMQYVYDVFKNPDFNRFKVSKNLPSSSPAPLTSLLAQQKKALEIEKQASEIQVNDAIYTLELHTDNARVKEWKRKQLVILEKEVRKEKQLQKDLDKICMEHPEPQISSFYDALKKLSKVSDIVAERVRKYPPLSKDDDQYFTSGVMLYLRWLQSIADLKNSRSNYSWIDIKMEQNNQSTHSAMSKSKIEAMFRSEEFKNLQGMMRKVTREQIDAKAPVIIDIARQVTLCAAILWGEMGAVIRDVFQELIDEGHPLLLNIASRIIENSKPLITIDIYKDMCQAPWNAGFHVRRHDKLSESAFGNASLH